jgi:hypothetical protein
MTNELQSAIEFLYVAFDDVPKPEIIEGCPCCIQEKGVDVLLIKPLKEITPDELTNYAASVFLTIGDTPDFLYLLPRILDILATDEGWWPDPEVVAAALKTARFSFWPVRHREAVLRYFDAIFNDMMSRDDVGWLLDSWMCAWGRLFDDISPYLMRLKQHPTQVVSYYEHNSESLIKERLTNAFWDDSLPAYRQIFDWFNSTKIKDMIKGAYGS